jgi:putative transposase
MAEHQAVWPVSVLWAVLAGSRSGFYDSLPRHAKSSVAAEQGALVARVKAIAVQPRPSSGSRRMATPLQEEGVHVGRAQARRLMKEAGGPGQRPKRRGPMTTDSRHGYAVAPNLLARPCDVSAPEQVWAGDIPSLWTAEGGR